MFEFSGLLGSLFKKNPLAGEEKIIKDPAAPDPSRIPRHVAIIMDGNGRWAKSRGLPRTAGHQAGLQRVREVVAESGRLGVEILTLYVFSTENWKRPPEEVSFLMNLFREALQEEVEEMHAKGVRVRFIGERDILDPDLIFLINNFEEKTAANKGLTVNLAINYGGRAEIISAVKNLLTEVEQGKINPAAIDENIFAKYLFTAGQPDPDLIIRTSGEERLSNFLLWQAAYSELIFISTPWPDFGVKEFHKAIIEYQKRNRRFGGLEGKGEGR